MAVAGVESRMPFAQRPMHACLHNLLIGPLGSLLWAHTDLTFTSFHQDLSSSAEEFQPGAPILFILYARLTELRFFERFSLKCAVPGVLCRGQPVAAALLAVCVACAPGQPPPQQRHEHF
eukprot:1159534-Pelagomonas_calceolata.AAC.6